MINSKQVRPKSYLSELELGSLLTGAISIFSLLMRNMYLERKSE